MMALLKKRLSTGHFSCCSSSWLPLAFAKAGGSDLSGMSPISREEQLAYIDLFRSEWELAIESPFHYLVFDEALSPEV